MEQPEETAALRRESGLRRQACFESVRGTPGHEQDAGVAWMSCRGLGSFAWCVRLPGSSGLSLGVGALAWCACLLGVWGLRDEPTLTYERSRRSYDGYLFRSRDCNFLKMPRDALCSLSAAMRYDCCGFAVLPCGVFWVWVLCLRRVPSCAQILPECAGCRQTCTHRSSTTPIPKSFLALTRAYPLAHVLPGPAFRSHLQVFLEVSSTDLRSRL